MGSRARAGSILGRGTVASERQNARKGRKRLNGRIRRTALSRSARSVVSVVSVYSFFWSGRHSRQQRRSGPYETRAEAKRPALSAPFLFFSAAHDQRPVRSR